MLLTKRKAGLDPQEFEFENSGAEALLKHKWSRSYFVIGGNAGHYVGRYVVGDGPDWPYEVYSWEPVMSRFSRWVKEVKDDVDTPDLWAELQRDARLLRKCFRRGQRKYAVHVGGTKRY